MLVATNPLIVTCFEEVEQYMESMINSVKIDFGKLKHCRDVTIDKMIICKNTQCTAVLSRFDSDNLLSRDVYLSNKDKLGPMATLRSEDFNQTRVESVWICKYCGSFQIVESIKRTNFMYMPSKFPIQHAKDSKAGQMPIVLFLIDYSASMEGMVCESGSSSQQMSRELMELMDGSQLVKKSKQYWRESITRMLSKLRERTQYQETPGFVTKKHFMLALLSKVLRLIKMTVESDAEQNRKIGFIFFNQIIFLAGDGTVKDFPIIHHTDYDTSSFDERNMLAQRTNRSRFRKADFNNFQSLFKIGAENGDQYKTKISELNHEGMDFCEITSEGKTALGPALAVALGIVSKHGEGSSIVVVTDGIANMGILEAEVQQPGVEKQMIDQLRKQKCLVGILQWVEPQKQQKEPTTNYFNKFVERNSQLLNRYEVNLGIDMEAIDLHTNALEKLAFRKVIAVICSFKIHCSAEFLTFEKTKFEEEVLEDGNLISSNRSYWLNIKLNKAAIRPEHYFEPIITQLLLRYQDVSTGQLMCYVSELEHRLSKNVKRMIQLINFENIQQYFDSEDIHNFSERCTIRNVDRTIRQSVRNISESMKSQRIFIDEINCGNDATSRSFRRS